MHRIDPRLKILWFFLYSILIFASNNLPSQFLLMAFTILGIIISGQNLLKLIKKVRFLLFFLPLTFGIHLFFSTSIISQFLSDGIRGINFSILYLPVLFTLRIADFIIFMSWILNWIDADGLLDGVYLILKPLEKLKLPVDDIFQIVFIAVRFFPIFQDEYKKMDTNWKNYTNMDDNENQLVKILNILVTLIIFSFRRSEKIAISMYVRGYGRGPRTYYTKLKFCFVDLLFFSFSVLFFVSMKKIGGVFGSI